MVQQGQFRADLYFRLGGVEMHVPPLRARRDDVVGAGAALPRPARSIREPLTLSTAAAEAMRLYHWPGNVRELERLIERAVALAQSDRIELADLPEAVRGEYSRGAGAVARRVAHACARGPAATRAWCSTAAAATSGKTCRMLDISYHTLQAYLRLRSRRGRPRAGEAVAGVGAHSRSARRDASGHES